MLESYVPERQQRWADGQNKVFHGAAWLGRERGAAWPGREGRGREEEGGREGGGGHLSHLGVILDSSGKVLIFTVLYTFSAKKC